MSDLHSTSMLFVALLIDVRFIDVRFTRDMDVVCSSVINPFGTIGLTTAIFFLLDSPVLVAPFYMGQPP